MWATRPRYIVGLVIHKGPTTPLYAKAVQMVASSDTSSELSRVVFRLDGFHLTMSFMDGLCPIMGGSRIKEAWSIIYAAIQIGNDMVPNNSNQLINRIMCMVKDGNDFLSTSQVHYVISLAFLRDLQTCTFLETVLYRQSENQCFQFPRCIYVGHLGFSKWPP